MPDATVVITTRNRSEDLRRALDSCIAQTSADLEILVYDDASTDGTFKMVSEHYPSVRLVRTETRRGYIVLRNCGFRDARSPLVISLDDDAWFSSRNTVAEIVQCARENPQTAAFALRYTEPLRTERQGYMTPLENGTQVRNYIGCAHAIRTEIALALNGYREYLVHQGEERDLCLRLLDACHPVRYLNTPIIIHQPSAKRDHTQLAYLGLRNTFLFDVINLPIMDLIWRLPADMLLLLKHRVTLRTFPRRVFNTLRGLLACLRYWTYRDPVRRETYRCFRELPSHGPVAPMQAGHLQASLDENSPNRRFIAST